LYNLWKGRRGDSLSWENSIILEKGEKTITSWKGNREIRERVVEKGKYGGRRIAEAKRNLSGFLVLTSQKLLFLEEHGMFGKSYHQTLSVPLSKVGAISMGGALLPFVSIADDVETHIFHVQGVGKKEFESFRQSIVEQCRKRREEIEAEKKKERVHIMVDFSFVKDYMKQGGVILQTFKCPTCGASLKFPESGNTTTCQYCNANIKAEDIFEKIKSLM
jgi:hypothetical protein